MKTKFQRELAISVARELCDALKPLCEPDRLKVAGSLRRRKGEVGDVEILYVPKFTAVVDSEDLFVGKTITINLVDETLKMWLAGLGSDRLPSLRWQLAKRQDKNGHTIWGESNKLAVHVATGIPVDLFTASQANWWNLVVCRTGPAESNTSICMAAERRGWKWDPYSAGFVDRHTGQLVYRARSERDVFSAVGLSYAEPWER